MAKWCKELQTNSNYHTYFKIVLIFLLAPTIIILNSLPSANILKTTFSTCTVSKKLLNNQIVPIEYKSSVQNMIKQRKVGKKAPPNPLFPPYATIFKMNEMYKNPGQENRMLL